MYLTTFEICVLKYINLILILFIDPSFCTRICMTSSSKKNKVKLDLLTDIYMLLIVEKSISGGIRHSIHRYAKTNNIYI